MMRRATTAMVMMAILGTTGLLAQAPPNFAGKWTLVPDPNAPAGGMAAQAIAITQDANTITLTRTTQMGEFTATYKLDGTESKNTVTVQGNSIEQLSTAKWDAAKLKIDTTMNFQGQPVQVSTALSLDPSGNLLVESTRPDFQGGGAPITTKTTYKKS